MTAQETQRKREMEISWKSYRGEFGDPLKVGRDQLNDNVISNRCAPVVDKGVSFLFGQPLKIEASDETPTGSSDIQDYIDGLWGDDDDKMSLLSKLAMNGGVCGQAFMKLIPPQGQMKYPRLVTLDPQIVRIVTPPDDCDLIQAFIIEYPGPNDTQCKQIIARVDPDGFAGIAGEYDLDDSWQIANFQRKNKNIGGINAQWEQVGETQTWPYPFPPIFTCQNLPNPNESWGIPDLTQDLIRQNRVLNFIQSNTARIIKYHAHPKTWAKGIGSTQIQMAVDDLTILQSDSAQLQNLEMSSDLSSSLNFAATIRSDMDEQSRVPAVALGRQADLPKGNISGVALALMFQPLIEKTTMKRRSYGAMIRQLTRAALVIAGLIDIADYENYAVDIHWSSLLPNDDLQAAQTALILQQLGASTSTLLSGLGLDPENEAQKVEKEQARQVQNYSRGVGLPPAQPPQPGQPGTAPTEATQAQLQGA
jgi:hypothetical protein